VEPRRIIACLLYAAVVLPIVLSVTVGVAHLLKSMADDQWANVLNRTCLIVAIVWAVNLICLLVALAVQAVARSDSSDRSSNQQ
jgi:preprotein translocase subunit SecG